ncbi:glycoside hydrolase family 15 protein [Ornithinimicrobium cryptoxanthini]|uniref:Glycoside hydrolase family 15 protein n=1 Tax=Ornithinimicrobium cryptoxanthini TaxID=2934161 RepID=A0ABY4YM64_9MICO|nr:glycoside hydrolase family 15 protein [Ornithinimicrobium cryptoxanthini]USQ77687.1 glycoside hydrolase family 15 protein [Ornithinimicrobium cryptoxanthini]
MSQRIEDYGVIGDLQTMALVGRDGSIDWLCLPRFDSGACFAKLLGTDDHGFWRIAPSAGGSCTRRHYRGDSLILETEWETPEGSVRVIDAMPVRDGAADVVRIVEGISGRVPVRSDLRLRFDYGHIIPWVNHTGHQMSAIAGPDSVWLDTPVELHGRDLTTEVEFEVSAGDRIPFLLTYHPSHEPAPARRDAELELRRTEAFWTEWVSRADYDGEWRDAVVRSLVTLKGLTYAPSGGIVAAATTSLPEEIGGSRNWDYRYCWLRDATFTLQALISTGYLAEAGAWRDWLLRAVAGDPADLQIMYSIDGTRRLTEYELPWLPGYEGSSPVRIGNGAASQFQLDVWGEALDGLHVAREAGLAGVTAGWDLQLALLDYLEGNWRRPDKSLWEIRGPDQQFVHSKVMAWAGIDRGIQAVEHFGLEGPVDRWRALREEIHTEVCREGFDADRGTFTQHYGSPGLDAALLLIPRVGFLPYADPRVVGTVEAVQRELSEEGFLLRYRTEHGVDGLPGHEGAFLLCSFWLADALHGIGRTGEARDLFERLLGLRNDLGLLAEEHDPVTGRHLGNTPQAFSHVGLVNSARVLSRS